MTGVLDSMSGIFVPTLRERPAATDAISHRLLLRGGFVRQLAAGLYSYLPLGWAAHQRIVDIIREELRAVGAQEMLMPLITPAELWRESGRDDVDVLYRLRDRADQEFFLAVSHEETATFHAREIRSYRELPQIWFHFGTKARDELRPRGGLLRVREFVMKDAYSFDRDEEGLARSYRRVADAYRRIFERCDIDVHEVESDVGVMGGSQAHEYLAPCEAGEDVIVRCERGDYAANLEVATSRPRPLSRGSQRMQAVPEPATTPSALAASAGEPPDSVLRAYLGAGKEGRMVLAFTRIGDRLHSAKLAKVLGEPVRLLDDAEAENVLGYSLAHAGPADASLPAILDDAVNGGGWVTGANRPGAAVLGFDAGRDGTRCTRADVREVAEGDACRSCGGALRLEPALEVGNIFKLGTRYSSRLDASYADEDGSQRPIFMGSYGIGPGRVLAATVEQHHDEDGIHWPSATAPYDIHLIPIEGPPSEIHSLATGIGDKLASRGVRVLLDDRRQRVGSKFVDADLIGCPVRLVVGSDAATSGIVELRWRGNGQELTVPASAADILTSLGHYGPAT